MNPSIARGSKQCNCMEGSMDFPLLGLLVTTEQIETNQVEHATPLYHVIPTFLVIFQLSGLVQPKIKLLTGYDTENNSGNPRPLQCFCIYNY